MKLNKIKKEQKREIYLINKKLQILGFTNDEIFDFWINIINETLLND